MEFMELSYKQPDSPDCFVTCAQVKGKPGRPRVVEKKPRLTAAQQAGQAVGAGLAAGDEVDPPLPQEEEPNLSLRQVEDEERAIKIRHSKRLSKKKRAKVLQVCYVRGVWEGKGGSGREGREGAGRVNWTLLRSRLVHS